MSEFRDDGRPLAVEGWRATILLVICGLIIWGLGFYVGLEMRLP